MKTLPTPRSGYQRTNLRSVMRIVAFVALVALIGIPLFSSSSASSSHQKLGVGTASTPTAARVSDRRLPNPENVRISDSLFAGNFLPFRPLSLVLPQSSTSIATYEYPGCTVPKDSFDLGETVCAIVTGAPLGVDGRAARRIGWVSPYGSLTQGAEIISDPQNGSYAIPSSPTQTFTDDGGGTITVDNRGTWKVSIYSAADGSLRESAAFTVHDPQTPSVDLSVNQAVSVQESEVSAGSSSVFHIFVTNHGPDSANVFVGESVPANTTFVSFVQNPGGPTFTCTTPSPGGTGTISCQVATMNPGDTVSFDFAYQVNAGTPAGTVITNFVNLDSGVLEIQPNDNSSTAQARVPTAGGPTACTLDCPDNINANANTEENGQRGAHVTYDAPVATGTCGSVTSTPGSGSFFPVGTTVVSATSEIGGGSCSFTVTVEDQGNNPPTITCPANQTANADSNCEAGVDVGTATATGNNVTLFATRSDGLPMYNCDVNGTNCTRRVPDDPFPAGTTTITWTATAHDSQGNDTGSASCTQTVTVSDITPPTITCPANITTGTDAGSCSSTVNPGTATATDNCDSPAVTGERSDGQALDAAYPKGTTTIAWTASDGTNSVSCTQTVTVNDTENPTITAPADSSASADASCQAALPDYVAGSTASDNCDSNVAVTQSPAAGTMVGAGPHTVTVTATDDEGNSSSDIVVFTVNDDTDPTVTAPADSSASADASCQAPVPDYAAGSTAADNCGNPTVTQNPAAGTMVGPGPHTVTVTATDSTGNTSSDTVVFTVNDTTAPTVTAPADSSASADASCQASVPNYAAGSTASDNCGNPTVTQSPAAGTAVGKGSHTVTVTATDAAGNSSSDTVVFTVNDTTPPVISCPANITQPTDPGSCSATVNPGTATATDNCGTVTVTGSRSDGQPLNAPYPAGTTTITWTATDGSGNQSSCTQTVTVNAPAATALGPANIWVGVKNSDSAGLRFDLKAEIYKGDTLIGSGEVFNVPGGSSGFNNAILNTIAIAQSQAASFCPGDQLKIKLSVRAGATGHVSGTGRLWYNDSAANSRFNATIDGNTNTYYLLDLFVTGTAAGPGPKKTIDVFVHRNQNGNAYKPFGTWVKTF